MKFVIAVLLMTPLMVAFAVRAAPVGGSQMSSGPAGPPLPDPATSAVTARENGALGYRISLPVGYRVIRSVLTENPDEPGHDAYTPRTEREEATLCKKDGGVGPDREADVRVRVLADNGRTALAYATLYKPRFSSVVPTAIRTYEAAKTSADVTGETSSYVIRANGFLYIIASDEPVQPSRQPKGWLDRIAQSFEATPRQPSPPSPSPPLAPPCSR